MLALCSEPVSVILKLLFFSSMMTSLDGVMFDEFLGGDWDLFFSFFIICSFVYTTLFFLSKLLWFNGD